MASLLKSYTNLPYDSRLTEEAFIRKRWSWMWTMGALFGIIFMTGLTVYVKLWPFLWYGIVLLLAYAIYIPVFRSAVKFDLISAVFCGLVILLTFIAMLQLSGITTSLGLVFVGLNCAMASVLTNNFKYTIWLFVLYSMTLIITGIAQVFMEPPDYVSDKINTLYFTLNALWINSSTIFFIFLYITDRNSFETEKLNKWKEVDEARSAFYANITHEFRTPLTLIICIADQIEENPDTYLSNGPSTIKKQSNSLLQLIDQMMEISKLKAGMTTTTITYGDIIFPLKEISESFRALADKKRISYQFISLIDTLQMEYDVNKLQHILSNLISNAIKFTPKNGSIFVQVEKIRKDNAPYVEILVKDNGVGISEEDLPLIFNQFYRATHKDAAPGHGLGLALTKGLVEKMGGSIEVVSDTKTGTEFHVYLPIISGNKVEETSHFGETPATIASDKTINDTGIISDNDLDPLDVLTKPILLIVEDNPDLLLYLNDILKEKYQVITAKDGVEGLESANKYVPDIILTDVMMPRMDGLTLVKKLKTNTCTSHIPIVVLTAMADYNSKIKGLEIGADHYLVKPFNKEELYVIINNLNSLRLNMQKKYAYAICDNLDHLNIGVNPQEIAFLSAIRSNVEKKLHEENFNIQSLCKSMHMSRAQVYRKFKALTNESLGRYIRTLKLKRAKLLISSGQMNISEAALESGFKDLSHFSHAYKEEFGHSPSEDKI